MLTQLKDDRLGEYNGIYIDLPDGDEQECYDNACVIHAIMYVRRLIANNQIGRTHVIETKDDKKILVPLLYNR